jgi:soluble lytic murein transglycosylase-like protein
MYRFLNLSAPAILLASAFGAGSLRTEVETPALQEPEVRQTTVPHNGFPIQYLPHEAAGPATRLWLGALADAAHVGIAGLRVEGFQESRGALRVGPAAPDGVPEASARGRLPVPGPFEKLIVSAASLYQIDPDFVASVVKAESGFDPTAISPRGAQGLMQVMPETAAVLGVENLLDPATNLLAGSRYLRQLLDQFAGDTVKALAAYVAGPERAELYGGILAPETHAYVTRIIDDYNRKKRQQANAPAAPAAK